MDFESFLAKNKCQILGTVRDEYIFYNDDLDGFFVFCPIEDSFFNLVKPWWMDDNYKELQIKLYKKGKNYFGNKLLAVGFNIFKNMMFITSDGFLKFFTATHHSFERAEKYGNKVFCCSKIKFNKDFLDKNPKFEAMMILDTIEKKIKNICPTQKTISTLKQLDNEIEYFD